MQILDEQYWNEKYLASQTGWDVGQVSTPLKQFIEKLQDMSLRILIPGAGNAHEPGYLLQQSFKNITVLDIAPAAIANVRAKLGEYEGKTLDLVCGDFFDYNGVFDLILEQTFFCAINPGLRRQYVQKMSSLLDENGILAGVLFNRRFDEGPPFGGDISEYQQLFSNAFDIITMEPCYNSIAPRAGTEVFIIARKKALNTNDE